VRENLNPVILSIAEFPAPVIAAVNGYAAGAGFGLALACDLLLAGRSASFVAPFSRLGLIADAGVGWYLSRLVGVRRARALIMLSETISAEQAARLGIANRLVEDHRLADEARTLAHQFAAGPTRGYALEKRSLSGTWGRSLTEQLELEADLQGQAGTSADYREGVEAFFSRRPATFTGR
jgi:2-(1,2-epoxy-1,2-dihydrophenyl)acetyl-CoA isomerase